jgi:cytochrome bd-type quinol oxidase subunit 2
MLLFVFVGVFITFFPNIFGGFETEHNVTVSNHTAEYSSLTELTQADLVIIAIIGTLLVLGMAFIMVKILT